MAKIICSPRNVFQSLDGFNEEHRYMSLLHSIDVDAEHYIILCNIQKFDCGIMYYPFAVCRRHCEKLCMALHLPYPISLLGTKEYFDCYQSLLRISREMKEYFNVEYVV